MSQGQQLEQFFINSWSGSVQGGAYVLTQNTKYLFEFHGTWTHRTNAVSYGISGQPLIYPGGYGSNSRDSYSDYFWRFAEAVPPPAGLSYPFLVDHPATGIGGTIKTPLFYFPNPPAYSSTHKYLAVAKADGTGTARFRFDDSNYSDNNGQLRVTIFEWFDDVIPAVRLGSRSDLGYKGSPRIQTQGSARSLQSTIRTPGKGATFV